jgi:glycosyltransferase involved in cell wall biosynthesis
VKAKELLVTVITPTYNRADYLDETIQSILNQDYPHLEYIVLDDGSKDHTIEVLKKYDNQITWTSHPNMGETRTVNKGLTMAQGDIIGIVNSDDPLLPGAIRKAVTVFQKNPDILLVYPDWNEIGPDSTVIKPIRLPNYDLFHMLTDFNVGMGPGVFFRRWAVEKLGVRDVQFKYAGDLDFWFRLRLHGRFFHVPEILATHRVHPNSASVTDQGKQMSDEVVRMIHKIFSYPEFPQELKPLQNQIYSRVHHSATLFCGSDRVAFLQHMILSFWYSPKDSMNRFFKYLPRAFTKRITRVLKQFRRADTR